MSGEYGNPKAVVRFFEQLNDDKTARAGQPVHDEMVEILYAGDKHTVTVALAHEKHQFVRDLSGRRWISYAEQFPQQYEAFKKGLDQQAVGTPLTELPFLSDKKRAEMRGLNVHTAEALAALEGAGLSKLGPYARSYKTQAQAYIERMAGMSSEVALRNEIEDLKARLTALTEAQSAAPAKPTSPFDGWTEDEMRAFLTANNKPDPHARTGRKKLVELCEQLNAELAAANGESQAA